MDVLPRAAVDPVLWDEVVSQSPDGWVYATSAWLNAIGEVAEWKLQDHSFAVQKNHRLVAVVPLHYTPVTAVLASSGFGWTGPVIRQGLGEREELKVAQRLYAHVDEIAAKLGAKEFQVACTPVTQRSLDSRWGISPFLRPGFEDQSGYSRVIDLSQSEETLWAELSDDSRRMIRKAQQAGYRVEAAAWKDHVEAYYRTHEETYQRTGVARHPKAYFEGIATHVDPQGGACLWVGFAPDGQAVAFHNSSCFGEGRSYHVGASQNAHVESGINYWLFWEALRGAKASGVLWYEAGEVFPGALSGKKHGLSVFKSKFGGELHRCFRASKRYGVEEKLPSRRALAVRQWCMASEGLLQEVLGERTVHHMRRVVRVVKRLMPASSAAEVMTVAQAEQHIRDAYEKDDVYKAKTICKVLDLQARDYLGGVLADNMQMVLEAYQGGVIVDLCCATGDHLLSLGQLKTLDKAVGIDFSRPFVVEAEARRKAAGLEHISFMCGNAKALPLPDQSVEVLYSMSSLYAIPEVEKVLQEIARVLKPGGTCVVEMGNIRSLNRLVAKAYPHIPPTFPITVLDMLGHVAAAGLTIRRHRCYQILPMWGDRPLWLRPLLLPIWRRLLAVRFKGKMLDEWVSSLPLMRRFAFRHVLLCEKTGQGPSVHARYGEFQADQREFFDALVTEEWHSYASDEWDDVRDFEVRQLMHRLKPKRILNIGCGTGYQDKAMAEYPWVQSVEGIDYSARSIEKAEEVYPHAKVSRFVADFLSLEEEQKYDLIVSFQVFEHFDQPEAYLEKAAALLAPGGTIAIVMPHWLRLDNRVRRWQGKEMIVCDPQHYREYTAQDVVEMSAAFGLKEAGGFAYGLSSAMIPGLGRLPYRWRTRLGYMLPHVANNIAVFLVKA